MREAHKKRARLSENTMMCCPLSPHPQPMFFSELSSQWKFPYIRSPKGYIKFKG